MSSPPLRTRFADFRTWAFVIVLAVLAVSIVSYRLIPGWGQPWGLDLKNVYLFHACASRNDPYLATGRACLDPLGRAMPYPPLMYWALAWTRGVSFEAARVLWASFIALTLALAALVWPSPRRPFFDRSRLREHLFGALLISQYPAVFAMERGNNDTFVVLLWTLAIAFFVSDRRALAGAFAGLAAAAKLYPAFSCAVVAAGVAAGALARDRSSSGPSERGPALRFAAGLALAPLAITLLFRTQTRHYLELVLPAFAAHLPGVSTHSHSVPATFGPAAKIVSGALIVAWIAAAVIASIRAARAADPRAAGERAMIEIFAGALAMSTYVARTSFDYNLVTVYPLLIVLSGRALESQGRAARASFAVLLLGLVSITGHRGWFAKGAVLHVGLQVAFLLAAAALTALSPRAESAEEGDALQPARAAT